MARTMPADYRGYKSDLGTTKSKFFEEDHSLPFHRYVESFDKNVTCTVCNSEDLIFFNAEKGQHERWKKWKHHETITDETKEPEVATGNALVRPGDITDAVDGRDLLDQFLSQNLQAVEKKVDARIIDKWLQDKKAQWQETYISKAQAAYDKLWAVCSKGKIGHNYRMMEVNGYNVNQCQDCKHSAPSIPWKEGSSQNGNHQTQLKMTKRMNKEMVTVLADRMIELDIEAGIFTWPTVEDYPNIQPKTGVVKKGFFSR